MTAPPSETITSTDTLGYAPAPRRRGRKWLRRVLFACTLAVAVLVLLRWGFVPLQLKAKLLHSQSQCLAFAPAPGTVAYTEDAATIARLTGGALSGTGWATMTHNGKPIAYSLAPEALRRVEQTPGVDLPQGTGPVFLHGRRASGGAERLVVVKTDVMRTYRVHGNKDVLGMDHLLNASVMRPATLTSSPSVTRTFWNPAAPAPAWGELTLFAGQPDPNDASHFTIDYLTPSGRGTIDGWLQADDTVKLAVRDGPLAQQAPATAPYTAPQ